MDGPTLLRLLTSAEKIPARLSEEQVPYRPGYYAIWVDDPGSLPELYAEKLRADNTKLIYVGIAQVSLHQRLVKQDICGGTSTFIRSIGAVLGYRPLRGSLVGNQRNYRFSPADKRLIVEWNKKHLSISFAEHADANLPTEAYVINELRPLLCIDNNPDALPQLAELREECRNIARSPL